MPLLDTLLAIDCQSRLQQEAARRYIHQYVQLEFEDNYTISNDGNNGNKTIYKEAEKLRLVQLFKKNYEDLVEAIQNKKFKNLSNIAEEFNYICTEYLNKHKIDANLSESKNSEVLELKSSSHEIPTHQCLLSHLNNRDLEGLKKALDTLKNHYTQDELDLFMNKSIKTKDRASPPFLPLLYLYTYEITSPYPLHNKEERIKDKQLAKFYSQAVQLLVQYGARPEVHNVVNSYGILMKTENSLLQNNLLAQAIFKALVNVGADPLVTDVCGHSLLYTLFNLDLEIQHFKEIQHFYTRFLIVECGVEADEMTVNQALYSPNTHELLCELQKERQEKAEKYLQKTNLITLSLFSSLPKPLVDLTLEYCRNYSPAFLRSIKKTKLKTEVEDSKRTGQKLSCSS